MDTVYFIEAQKIKAGKDFMEGVSNRKKMRRRNASVVMVGL